MANYQNINGNLIVDGNITATGTVSGSGSGVATVGTIDSQTKSANGLVITGTNIYAQSADATNPGLVTTGTQTFAGVKTFTEPVILNETKSNSTSGTFQYVSKRIVLKNSGTYSSGNNINLTKDGNNTVGQNNIAVPVSEIVTTGSYAYMITGMVILRITAISGTVTTTNPVAVGGHIIAHSPGGYGNGTFGGSGGGAAMSFLNSSNINCGMVPSFILGNTVTTLGNSAGLNVFIPVITYSGGGTITIKAIADLSITFMVV